MVSQTELLSLENKIREYPGDIDTYLKEKTIEIEIPSKQKEKKLINIK